MFYTGYGICMAYLDSHRTEYRRRAGGVYEVLALINAIEVCIVGSFTKGKSITASQISNDAHVGLSKFSGHSDKKWEIVLAGWAGHQSVIRTRSSFYV